MPAATCRTLIWDASLRASEVLRYSIKWGVMRRWPCGYVFSGFVARSALMSGAVAPPP